MGDKPAAPRRASSGRRVAAAILIAIGAYWLARRLGWQDPGVLYTLGRFWPLVLIVIGMELAFGRRRRGLGLLAGGLVAVALAAALVGSGEVQLQPRVILVPLDEPRAAVRSAQITLETDGAELTLRQLPAEGDRLLAGSFAAVDAEVDREREERDGVLVLSFEGHSSHMMRFDEAKPSWDIQLAPDLPIDLTVDAGDSTFTIDARELTLSSLTLNAGASEGTLILPATGTPRVVIEAGASVLTIEIPAGRAVRISATDLAISELAADARFIRDGDAYVTPEWAGATDRLEVVLEGGAASITLR